MNIPQQVVPWASAFVGGTAASWLAYKLAPKKYRAFLGGLGLLGGGALSYFLADKYLVPATSPASATSGQSSAPAADHIQQAADQPPEQQPPLQPREQEQLTEQDQSTEVVPEQTPAATHPQQVSWFPKFVRATGTGTLAGFQDFWDKAQQYSKENPLLPEKVVDLNKNIEAAEIPFLFSKTLSPVLRAHWKAGQVADAAQTLMNTVADAKHGLKDNAYGEEAIERNSEFHGKNRTTAENFLFNLNRQIADKFLNTASTIGIFYSPYGLAGATQTFKAAPHIPVGEIVGTAKEYGRMLAAGAKGGDPQNETGKQLNILADTLYKSRKGESGLKTWLRGTAKLLSGGAYGEDIYKHKTVDEKLAERSIDTSRLKSVKERLTAEALEKNKALKEAYNSGDPIRRSRARRQINREISPLLNRLFI